MPMEAWGYIQQVEFGVKVLARSDAVSSAASLDELKSNGTRILVGMKGEAVAGCIRNLLDRDFQDSSTFVGVARRFCHSRVG